MNRFILYHLIIISLIHQGSNALATEETNKIAHQITLQKSLKLALKKNLGLQTASFNHQILKNRGRQQTLLPNPSLEIGSNHIGEQKIGVGISQEFEISGKRSSTKNVTRVLLEQNSLNFEKLKADFTTNIEILFFEAYALQQKNVLLGRAIDSALGVHKAIKKRHLSGASPKLEVIGSKLIVTNLKNRLRRNQASLRAKKFSLASLWGGQQESFTLSLEKAFPPSIRTYSVYLKELDKSLDIAIARKKQSLAVADVDLQKSLGIPNVEVGATYVRDMIDNSNVLELSVAMPLPVFNRNQWGLKASLNKLQQSNRNAKNRRVTLIARLNETYTSLENNFNEVELYIKEIIPQTQETFDEIKHLYQSGRQSYLALSSAQKSLIETEINLINTTKIFYISLAQISNLTATSEINQ